MVPGQLADHIGFVVGTYATACDLDCSAQDRPHCAASARAGGFERIADQAALVGVVRPAKAAAFEEFLRAVIVGSDEGDDPRAALAPRELFARTAKNSAPNAPPARPGADIDADLVSAGIVRAGIESDHADRDLPSSAIRS